MQKINRRDFIKVGATATAAGAAVWASRQSARPRAKIDTAGAATAKEERLVKTTCAMCPSGCGLEVRVVDGRAVKVEGNPLHPINQGVCCLKGQASLEMLYSPERIQRPRMQTGARGGGDWQEISWEQALELVGEKLNSLRAIGEAHTVALMHGELRGQMRPLVERFMRAYGSPNVISSESLGASAARLAMYLSQGIRGYPIYDLNRANYVFAFGGNLLESSRSLIGNLGSVAFMRRGRPQRGKLVAAHPRLSLTGIKADEWVPIRPGTYGALALGMAAVIVNSNLYDEEFVRDFTFGFEDFKDTQGNLHQGFKNLLLEHYTLERVASITGVASETIARLAGEFATNRPAVAIMPTEPGELSSGNSLYTALAIHALNALVGSIDSPGGVLVQRFPSLAEWPEMELDQLAQGNLEIPRLDGAGSAALPLATSVYQSVATHILEERPYPINALILLNANPVYEVPDNGRFVEALMKVPFVVSLASTLDESAAHADLILPSSTFLEMWGDDLLEGTGFAGVSLRQPVVEPVHDTRNPGDVILQLCHMLGEPLRSALPWKDYWQLVQARLSGIDMDWEKFKTNGSWSEMVYFNAAPGSPAWSQVVGRDRLNAPKDGRFDFYSRELFSLFSGGGQPEEIDLACLPHFELPDTLDSNKPDPQEYPLFLVSQQLITQTGNWQGITPTLQEAYGLQSHAKWRSWVEINPRLAEKLGLEEGQLVWVASPQGKLQAEVRLYEGIWPNAVYLPPGLGHRSWVRWGRNSPENLLVGANPNQLVRMDTEALSGMAVFNPARVMIYKV